MKSRLKFFILALALTGLAVTFAVASNLSDLDANQASEAITQTPGLVILDIRTPDEFHSGHIKDAQNIDFYGADFQQNIDALNKDIPYFIYCRSGRRSGITVKYMEDAGFKRILHLEKGINSWKGAGLPLVR